MTTEHTSLWEGRTVQEVTEKLNEYVFCVESHKEALRFAVSFQAIRDIQHPELTPEQVGRVVSVLLDEAETNWKDVENEIFRNADLVGIGGLCNLACPPEVLARACHSKIQMYRYYATRHPNCPEEAAIEAFLIGDMDPSLP